MIPDSFALTRRCGGYLLVIGVMMTASLLVPWLSEMVSFGRCIRTILPDIRYWAVSARSARIGETILAPGTAFLKPPASIFLDQGAF